MKKIALLVALLCATTLFAFSQESEPHANVGDLIVNGGANLGWGSFGVGAGAEYIFYKWDIPNFAPLTFGGAAKAGVFFGSSIHFDVAALATMHFGLKTFTTLPEFLQNLDWYWGVGAGLGIGSTGGFGISTGSGICYYLNPTLAISSEYFYTNYFGAGAGHIGVFGVRLEL